MQWSVSVQVGTFSIYATLWYAGWVMDNAREETAEDMLRYLVFLEPYRQRELSAMCLVERPLPIVLPQELGRDPRVVWLRGETREGPRNRKGGRMENG